MDGKTVSLKKSKEIEERIIEVCLRIANRGEGALIVFGDAKFTPLVEQSVPPFKISDNLKLLESLALIDGAIIVDKKGIMQNYGVMIKSRKALKGFGTRHSAALNASLVKGTTSFIVSEEDKKVRILRNGKMIMQVDALEKGIEKKTSEISNILASVGAGTIGTIGISLLVPSVGLALIPGVILFGSTYFLIQKLKDFGKVRKKLPVIILGSGVIVLSVLLMYLPQPQLIL